MTTMTKPDFVYVTYIATTAEELWRALADVEVMREYWMGQEGPARVNVSDWKVGSRWEHQRADESRKVDVVGTVVEIEPPRRLVLTWARPTDEDDESRHSRVTFDIEPAANGQMRLTVSHSDLEGDPKMLAGISSGWPQVLSNLKTLLETGRGYKRS